MGKFLWALVTTGLFSLSAQATVLVNPPAPYLPQRTFTDGIANTSYTLTFGGGPETGPPSGFVDTSQGFRFINTTLPNDPANLIWLDVTSNANFGTVSGSVLVVSLSTDSSSCGQEIKLTGAGLVAGNGLPPNCTDYGNCQGTTHLSASYSQGSTLRLSFSLADACASAMSQPFCAAYINNGSPVTTGQTQTLPIYVTFGTAPDTTNPGPVGSSVCATTTPVPGTTTISPDTTTVNLVLSDQAPQITSCPTDITKYYFPGDGQIYLKTGNFNQDPVSTNVPVSSFIFLAQLGGPADPLPGGLTTNNIVSRVPAAGSEQTITGFIDSTNGSDNVYQTDVYLENQAGLISGQNTNGCQQSVTAQAISGILTESKCFIATATYHDGHAAPVMLLRHFRDRVLSKFELGRKFIETYYRYSPALAEWAWDKPIIRSIALKFLTPVEMGAWAILKFTHADPVDQAVPSYSERMKKKIADEDAAAGKTDTDSFTGYSDQQKKKLLQPSPDPEGYSHRQKRILNKQADAPDLNTSGYSAGEKAKLPASDEPEESPIKVVKEGRDPIRQKVHPPVSDGFAFKLGVNPGTEVNVIGARLTYDDIYGGAWTPDVYFHYEHQFFRSEEWGSLALTGEFGFSYAKGFGQLSFPFPNDATGTTTSQTAFHFVQVPVLIGANFRFNLFRAIKPYVGASVGTMGYAELRDDDRGTKKGYSFIYSTTVGASLLLDFLDKEANREGYLSYGIQHVYLFAEYLYLNTFSGSVTFKRGGVYAGFLFEF